jgi:hypothetical protein
VLLAYYRRSADAFARVAGITNIEQLTSALYLDDRQDIDHYLEVMYELSTQALTPDRTTRFIAEITREI